MLVLSRLDGLIESLQSEIISNKNDLLNIFPIDTYIGLLDRYPETCSYDYISLNVQRFCDNIILKSNEHVMEIYHKLTLVTLIEKAQRVLETKRLPGDIKSLYKKHFGRIINTIEANTNPREFYKYPNDAFLKDLSLCNLRMIPVGARKMHLAGLPKMFLFADGFKQLIKGLTLLLFELRSFSPFYRTHLDSKDPDVMAEFTPEGHRLAHWRIAQVLKMHEEVKGVFGACWFFDPVIEKISPRLAYLRQVFVEGGVVFFCLGPLPEAIKDATAKSPTRRRMYNEGKYLPVEYFWIWPRRRLIEWADKQNISSY